MLSVAFGESTMRRIQVHLRYNRFKKGREDVNDDARRGCPPISTIDENIEAAKKIILDIIIFDLCQAIISDVL